MQVVSERGTQGPGHLLYETLGFCRCEGPGPGFEDVEAVTGYSSGEDEIRMRLALRAPDKLTRTRGSTQELPR